MTALLEAIRRSCNADSQRSVLVLIPKLPTPILQLIYELLRVSPLLISALESGLNVEGTIQDKDLNEYIIVAGIRISYANYDGAFGSPAIQEPNLEIFLGVRPEYIGIPSDAIVVLSTYGITEEELWSWFWRGESIHHLLPNYTDKNTQALCPPYMPPPWAYASRMLALLRARLADAAAYQ